MEISSLNNLAYAIKLPRGYLENLIVRKSACYRPFLKYKPRRNGTVKKRRIDNPNEEIRTVQRKINQIILSPLVAKLPEYMHGSIKGHSIATNARGHVAKPAVLSLDLQGCFPSITPDMVYAVYRNRAGCIPEVARLLTKLSTFGNKLPQGAPTSSSLCNLVLAPLCKNLYDIARENNVEFSQYVDDLFFSGNYDDVIAIYHMVISKINSAGFVINSKKVKLTKNNRLVSITGVVANQKISAGRKRIRRIERKIMKLENTNDMQVSKIMGEISFIKTLDVTQHKHLSKKLKNRLEVL